jgi:hypothetical protein
MNRWIKWLYNLGNRTFYFLTYIINICTPCVILQWSLVTLTLWFSGKLSGWMRSPNNWITYIIIHFLSQKNCLEGEASGLTRLHCISLWAKCWETNAHKTIMVNGIELTNPMLYWSSNIDNMPWVNQGYFKTILDMQY